MKPFLRPLTFALLSGALLAVGCGGDDTDPVPNRAPTITLNGASAAGRIDSLSEGAVNAVEVTVDDLDNNLNTIRFQRNGTDVTATTGNVRSDATTPIAANPLLILGDDKGGFTRTYFFRTALDAGDSVTYTIIVEDEDGLRASSDIMLVNARPRTRISRTLNGVLLNQAGPVNTGGLDLDTGEGTGSQDTIAEIRDRGIDTDRPVSQNWLQQIAPVGNAVLRKPSATFFMENNLTFDNVQFTEEIEAAFFSTSVDEPRSDKITGGEVFVVRDNGRFYLIEIASVTVTPNNNDDSYSINIKY